MTEEKKQITEKERQEEIAALKNLLQQNDYAARQVAFEVARIIKKVHPEEPMPALEKYIEMENKADQFRARINELEEMEVIPDAAE